MTPDFWSHQYQTQANQVLVSTVKRHFDNSSCANMYGLTHDAPCCLCNMHQPWPRLVESLWMATHDNGLVAVAYGPCEVTAKVGAEGAPVAIAEETDYPFDGKIRVTLKLARPVEFPLQLRIPAWAARATITAGGERLEPKSGGVAVLKRAWKPGGVVELNLPMELRIETRCRNAVWILRGPLYFSLRIGQEYRSGHVASGFPIFNWEIHPTTPWNYGLIIDRERPEESVRVETHPVGRLPFAQKGEPFIRKVAANEKADWRVSFRDWNEGETKSVAFAKAIWRQNEPVVLKVKGRRVLNWRLQQHSAGSLPAKLQEAPGPEADLELVPYGCTRLRVTEFPLLGAVASSLASNYQPPAAAFLRVDKVRQGRWKGVYGADGYEMAYGQFKKSFRGAELECAGDGWDYEKSIADVRALQKPDAAGGIAAARYADSVELYLSVGHEQPRQVALYVCEWDRRGRAMRVRATDAASGKELCGTDVADFGNGCYLVFEVKGAVTFTMTRTAGVNAVLQGVFLDPAASRTHGPSLGK